MTAGRRFADFIALLGMILLVGSVAGTGWWLTRPNTPATIVPLDPARLDVVCSGRVDVSGTVVPLVPAQAGRIVEVLVEEGATVQPGQVLIRLDSTAAKAQLLQAEAALNVAQVELEAAIQEAERWPTQLSAREQLLFAARARVEAAKQLLQQRRDQAAVAPLGRGEHEALEARIRELEALEAAERGQIADLRKIDPRLKIRACEARLQAAQADLALARQAVQETVLKAPAEGTILRLQASVGGMIGPGSPIPAIVFAPAGRLVIRAEIEQEFLGRVRVGMKALVHDESRGDGPQWHGRVSQLASWVAQKRSFLLDPGEINDVRTVECVIELESPGSGLWIGQRMRVRLLQQD